MVRCVYIEAHGITPSITNYTNNYQELPVHTLPPNMVASHTGRINKVTLRNPRIGDVLNTKQILYFKNEKNKSEALTFTILSTGINSINKVLIFDSEDLGTDNITVKNSTLFNKSNMETLASFMLNFPKKTLHDLKKDYLRFNSKSFDSLKKKDSFTDDELIKIFKTEYLVFQKYLESGIDLMNMDNYRILSKSRLQNKPIAEKTFRNFLHCLIQDSLYSFELLSKLLTEDEISKREVLKELFLDIIDA